MITAELVLETFAEDLVNDLRQALKDRGVTFGGGGDSKLAAQIRFRIIPITDGVEFQLIMPDYAKWVDEGRGPGPVSKEGKKSIEEWGRRKGYISGFAQKDLIRRKDKQAQSTRKNLKTLKPMPFNKAKEAFGFVVARTVSKNGYKGNNFLTDIIGDGRVETLKKDIEYFLKQSA